MAERFSPLAWLRAVLAPTCTLDPMESLVLLALVKHADDEGQAFPGMGLLARETRVSRRKVLLALDYLAESGVLKREKQTRGQGFGSNNYWLSPKPPTSALGAPRDARPVVHPMHQGSAPGAPLVVHGVHMGSAPGAPYLDQELPNGTAQGAGALPPVAAPATPSLALTLEVQDPKKKEPIVEGVKPKTGPKPRARSWRIVPAEWKPSERHAERARELGVSLAAEVEKFRKHHYDRPRRDANATFSNWLERALEFASRQTNGRGRHAPQESDPSAVAAVIARYQGDQRP